MTLVVPFAAGGGVDQTGRSLAENVKSYFPQPISVVNRTGGGGSVGAVEVIQAAPDGYTIGITGASAIITPYVSELPYKGVADFRPIINIVIAPLVWAVPASSPYQSMKEMLDYAKANPAKIRVGTTGYGASTGIALEVLKDKTGINMTQVPTSGAAEVITQLLGEHLEAGLPNAGEIYPHVQAGKAKVLAVLEEKRTPLFPNAPTLKEVLGYEVVSGTNFYFIFGPKGTPDDVSKTLHDALKKAAETDAFKKYAEDMGFVIDYRGLDDLKKDLERKESLFSSMLEKTGQIKKKG